jgi:hypothetical protein
MYREGGASDTFGLLVQRKINHEMRFFEVPPQRLEGFRGADRSPVSMLGISLCIKIIFIVSGMPDVPEKKTVPAKNFEVTIYIYNKC